MGDGVSCGCHMYNRREGRDGRGGRMAEVIVWNGNFGFDDLATAST